MKCALALILVFLWHSSVLAQGPRYASAACPSSMQNQAGTAEIICGRLHVPANRQAPAGAEVSLFVLRIKAPTAQPQPPLLILAGGPGEAASSQLAQWLRSELWRDFDIILLDQRGAGLSRPLLACPELAEVVDSAGIRACRARLLAAGIELADYSSAASVQDLRDLLRALELPAVNLYGQSYGSRLALEFAQQFQVQVGAIVLDGLYPPQAQVLAALAENVQRALEQLFADCRADALCNRAYPNLAAQFKATVTALDARPAEVGVAGGALRLTGADFALYVSGLLADGVRLSYLPALIAAYAAGEYAYLPWGADSASEAPFSDGLFLSIFCAEEAQRTSAAEIEARGAALPSALAALTVTALDLLADCDFWPVPPAPPPASAAPIDIPTLLLSGRYDPITPPRWAEALEARLPKSWHIVLPAGGHIALENGSCAEAALRAFLRQPTALPTVACLRDLAAPAFFIAEN